MLLRYSLIVYFRLSYPVLAMQVYTLPAQEFPLLARSLSRWPTTIIHTLKAGILKREEYLLISFIIALNDQVLQLPR